MRVLGIDLSNTHTGLFSTFHDKGMTIEPRGKTGPERLDYIERMVRERLERDQPQLVVLEGYNYAATQGREMAGEVGGIIRLTLYRLGYGERYAVVPPSSLKLFATGYGLADKGAMIAAAEAHWGKKMPDDHQADAYWLAQVGVCLLQRPTEWQGIKPKQIEIVQAVKANQTGKQVKK